MIGVAFVGVVQSPYVAIALLSLGGFAHQTLSVTVITMSSDLFRRNEVATVAGMAGTCGNAGVLIFSLLIGGLVTTIGYTPFFVGLAVLDLLGACILWTSCASRRPPRRRPAAARRQPDRCPTRRYASTIRSCRGFNPDPSIVRVGDDYYIATSTFEWFPGVQIHHSRDLVHWRLLTRPLDAPSQLNMLGDPDSCGVWAPCLTYADGLFWLDLHRRQALRPDLAAGGSAGASLRDFHNYLVTSPQHRRRLVRSGLPQQQRLRSVAVPRRRRPQVPA